ncbi:(2Fe-2S) ferredoxin domain-containing protein [Desulfosarcina cetonica]|uniref:(2Fe-2S) ferredoxin domain-containing protein n=1 Tax=Desulfosarcina cetonica TaxID=90730 RepID=UPI001C44312A|nr:NAD(P)H-dependent oxidoreductase subunit E [Desulfosarcina cetonica]
MSEKDPDKPCIAICAGTNCLALGNQAVIQAFKAELAQQELTDKVDIRATGCHGLCERGPNVLIYPEEIYYIEVKPEDVAEIISETVLGKKVVDRLLYTDPLTGEKAVHQTDIPFYKKQTRMIINTNTLIDPQKIEDYLSIGGYTALSKALFEMTPESILNEIKTANLRGRGGGGFPAGLKWETARNAPGEQKYVIVNGHEGEPGAFMDRAIFTGNPHNVIEGLIIGAFAVGASQGFIYTRHDMPQLKENIYTALAQAEEYGLLGDNILGSGFNFHVEVHFDVGIFVSGESSA